MSIQPHESKLNVPENCCSVDFKFSGKMHVKKAEHLCKIFIAKKPGVKKVTVFCEQLLALYCIG